ncbi:MAG: thioredoxin fold domain-containing protein [Halobacteria archaeon]
MAPGRNAITAAATAAVVVALLAAASQVPVVSDARFGYAGGMAWEKASAGGLERALAAGDGKPAAVYFWASWCQYCKKFDTELFPDPAIQPLLQERFHRVFVDLDEDRRNASRYGVLYPPTLLFLNSSGSVLFRLNGFLERDDLLSLLRDVLSGSAVGNRSGNQTLADPGTSP